MCSAGRETQKRYRGVYSVEFLNTHSNARRPGYVALPGRNGPPSSLPRLRSWSRASRQPDSMSLLLHDRDLCRGMQRGNWKNANHTECVLNRVVVLASHWSKSNHYQGSTPAERHCECTARVARPRRSYARLPLRLPERAAFPTKIYWY